VVPHMTPYPPPHTLGVIHKGLPESSQEMPFLPLDGELLHREGLSKQRRALVSKQMPVAAVQVALRHPTGDAAPVSPSTVKRCADLRHRTC